MNDVLILYSTAGIGHKKAAFAVKEAFDRNKNPARLEDALDYTNAFFKRSYNGTYLFLVKYLPTIWGLFYYLLDNAWFYALVRPMRRLTNHINCKKLVEFLLATKPATIIVTHFLPLEVIADLKRKGLLKTRLISVITDYKPHTFWISKYVDTYVAASDYTKEDLAKRGTPEERIKVFGIPCAKSFSEKRNRETLRTKIGLAPHRKTLFVLGGGFGVGPIKNIVSRLEGLSEDFQGIVVCGYNKKLYEAVLKITRSAKHFFKVYRFIDNVDELMACSDVLISKPGGITVTEALNAGLPMIVISPIPGQEMRNYKFLEKNNAAVKIRNTKEIEKVVKNLFSYDALKNLKENVEKIRLPDSGDRIMNEALK